MARVDAVGGSGYVIDNGTGLNVRTKLNQIAAAINSLNSGTGDPSINTAFQPHINTSTSELKIRNAANDGYITLGKVNEANFGLLPLTGGTLTGTLTHNYTGAMRLPVGTTAQRPSSPAAGDFRYNSTTNKPEFYNGSSFLNTGMDDFTQTGTGASARTFQSKGEDILSVKDFGATGDGSTNDSTAIQAAINAARGSSKVYIPKGTYRVNKTIEIPSNSHLVGDGKSTVIKMMDSVGRDTTLMRTGKRAVTITGTYAQSGTTVTVTITGNHTVTNADGSNRTNYSVLAPAVQRLVTADFTTGSSTDGTYEITAVDSSAGTFTFTVANSVTTSGNVSVTIGGKIQYVTIEDMTLDFNSQRHSVSGGERLEDTITDVAFTNGDAKQDNQADTLCICFTEYALIKNVRCLDAYKHCLDVTAPKFKRGSNGATYDADPSKFVTIENCFFKGAGDDNLTTHFSSDILITGCRSERPAGHLVPQNSNCFEVDDGSRNVTLTNNTAIKGIKGMQIKGHNYAPAPYNVVVDGLRAVNCNMGLDIRHSGFHGNDSTGFTGDGSTAAFTLPSGFGDTPRVYVGGTLKTITTHYTVSGTTLTFTSGNIPAAPTISGEKNIVVYKTSTANEDEDDQITDDDGNVIRFTGSSPTARNVSVSNVTIIAPLEIKNTKTGESETTHNPDYCIRCVSYENVQFTNIVCSDGSLDLADDFEDYVATTFDGSGVKNGGGVSSDSVFRLFFGASNVLIQNLSIFGFSDLEKGFYVSTSYSNNFVLDGFNCVGGPKFAIRCLGTSATYQGFIDNFLIKGSSGTPTTLNQSDLGTTGSPRNLEQKAAGIRITASNVSVGRGSVNRVKDGSGNTTSGYDVAVKGGLGSTDDAQPAPFTLTRATRSTGGTETVPISVIRLDQQEGDDQNLGKGEGLKISWRKQEVGDSTPEEICFLGSFKEETSDTDDDYSLVVGTTTTAGTVSKKFEFTSGGNFIPSDDNSQDLGSSSNRFDDVFATNGSIQTSDERQKQDFETITEAEKRVATVLKGKLKKYRFKDAVTSKGEKARIHFGIVAQEIKAAFEAESLDPATYGMFCYDEMFTTDEDGNKTKVSDSYGVRYSELFAFILAST